MPKNVWGNILTKEFLEREYVKNKKTTREIAKEIGAEKTTILYWLKKTGIKPNSIEDYRENLLDKKFGKLLVIEKGYGGKWKCLCSCNKVIFVESGNLQKGQKSCFKCRSETISELVWKGFGEISGEVYSGIKNCADSRNIEFKVSIEYIWNLFLSQNRKCALTDIELIFQKRGEEARNRGLKTASLDRIDSKKGYIEGNVQWVHKDVNRMKREYTQERFIEICLKVAERYKNVIKT